LPTGATVTVSPTHTAYRITPASKTPARPVCVGDCLRNYDVAINELVTGVNIGLGRAAPQICAPFAPNRDGRVTVDELVLGVRNALRGCP
jgi:hypothetical protein